MLNSINLPLSPRKVAKKTLEAFPALFGISAIIFLGIFASLGMIRNEYSLAVFISAVIILIMWILEVLYQYYYYKTYYYNFGENEAEIRKGVISRAAGHVRYERIQNIFVDQDFLDRIFGLYDIHYETAGETSRFYSHVDGLTVKNAEALVDFLKNRVGKHMPDGPTEVLMGDMNIGEKTMQQDTEVFFTRENMPIQKKGIIMSTIGTLAILSWVFLYGFIMMVKVNGAFMIPVVILAFLFISASLIYYSWWYKNFYFKFEAAQGVISEKVITLTESYVYYDRIQNINVTQGILERAFGLYSVSIETAAEALKPEKTPRLVIPYLLKDDAEMLKSFLFEKARAYKNTL